MSNHKCLIVEDSPMMRQLIIFALGRVKNLDVEEADDGLTALKKMSKNKYDIFIVDINMPIMDGLKLIKRIRSDEVHKSAPVIIVTTEGAKEDQERAMHLGVQEYITKPIQAPQIIAKVKRLLETS